MWRSIILSRSARLPSLVAAFLSALSVLLVTTAAVADDGNPAGPQVAAAGGDTLISGMSILGNHEAPKSLVIVPWKSSEIGRKEALMSDALDGIGPVDRDVFMRELDYYEIREGRSAP